MGPIRGPRAYAGLVCGRRQFQALSSPAYKPACAGRLPNVKGAERSPKSFECVGGLGAPLLIREKDRRPSHDAGSGGRGNLEKSARCIEVTHESPGPSRALLSRGTRLQRREQGNHLSSIRHQHRGNGAPIDFDRIVCRYGKLLRGCRMHCCFDRFDR